VIPREKGIINGSLDVHALRAAVTFLGGRSMKLPKHVEFWDDERNLDHGILVTLQYGWSFYEREHQGVMSFEAITEAREAIKLKNVYRCSCDACRNYIGVRDLER
jgi:hypothetical protein